MDTGTLAVSKNQQKPHCLSLYCHGILLAIKTQNLNVLNGNILKIKPHRQNPSTATQRTHNPLEKRRNFAATLLGTILAQKSGNGAVMERQRNEPEAVLG